MGLGVVYILLASLRIRFYEGLHVLGMVHVLVDVLGLMFLFCLSSTVFEEVLLVVTWTLVE